MAPGSLGRWPSHPSARCGRATSPSSGRPPSSPTWARGCRRWPSGVLVTARTHQPGWTGLVAAAAFIPMGLLAPVGGALADRLDRRRWLIVTTVAEMAFATVLPCWPPPGTTVPASWSSWPFSAVPRPPSDSRPIRPCCPTWCRPEDLLGAVSLSSAQFNLGRVIGPALAGLALLDHDYRPRLRHQRCILRRRGGGAGPGPAPETGAGGHHRHPGGPHRGRGPHRHVRAGLPERHRPHRRGRPARRRRSSPWSRPWPSRCCTAAAAPPPCWSPPRESVPWWRRWRWSTSPSGWAAAGCSRAHCSCCRWR